MTEKLSGAAFYVATNGNDAWSGTLPAPNGAKTDGPFATLGRARDAVRAAKGAKGLTAPVTVMLRAGTYYLSEPLRFTPEDSGTGQCPITYTAYPGEKVALSGGRRITGWATKDGQVFTAHVPEVKQGKLYFRLLRSGEQPLIRARYPNYDPQNPIQGGWLFARKPPEWQGGFGTSVAAIHNVGDYLEYEIDAPATADYDYWAYVAMKNQPHTTADISGKTAITVDGGEPVPLMNMADTGDWHAFQWRKAARVHLSQGRHRLRWENLKGGGINFDAFALTDDLNWNPTDTKLPAVAAGRHLLVVQAEAHVKAHGPQMKLDTGKALETKTELYVDRGAFKLWPESREAEIHICPRYGWVNGIVPVVGFDPDRSMLRLAEDWPEKVWAGNRFFVENVFEELDAPGEWYLDRDTGDLYLRPPQSFDQSEVVAAVMDRVIEFCGDPDKDRWVSHITFSGFTICDTTYSPVVKSWYFPCNAAVWLTGASHCRVTQCQFRHVGGYAVIIASGSHDSQIVGNEVASPGQGGVFIDGGKAENPQQSGPPALRPRRNQVSGNYIHHAGAIYKHVAGVYISHADENIVSHNLIHDVPRYAISVKYDCAHNVIEFNEVRRTNLETNDTGGIEHYLNRKPSVIRGNLIADTVGLKTTPDGQFQTPFFCWGIYLDGYTSHATVTQNIVFRNYRGGIMVGAGSENVIANNIFVEATTSQVEFYDSRPEGKGNKFQRNIVCYAAPDGSALHLLQWRKDFVESDHNLFFRVGGKLDVLTSGAQRRPWEDWLALGMDAHSLIADPLFLDPTKDDYRLKPDSPALKLGFQPIPVEKIGLKGYEGAWKIEASKP